MDAGNIATGEIQLYTQALRRMTIDYGGNVGIGYDAPGTAKLAVNGNVGIGTTGPWEKLSLPYNSKISLGASTLYNFNIYKASAGDLITYFDSRYDVAASYVQFRMRTGGTPVNVMTLTGAGNVGIGTTSPGAALEIGGSGNVRIGGLSVSSGV